ncbi:MAG: hypothetical protein BWY43_00100 [candidate division WS2 bacterium ADurb.Bin280]|uniref:HTH marR-type domain-containing protein n=1 Tax=candidate division WS2 bacterium ADurb.Bin280 TaxID=1852829 RepID=A0A1V5SG02_9BACT|nr:MAG: hypothetical protein BWY43_00100 [candidate division WS2 bacterium ADurb.Bin280]
MIYFAIGLIIGIIIGILSRPAAGTANKEGSAREDNISELKTLFEREEKVTNDDVEKSLGVSDSTATRYLDQLEKDGFIVQIGEEGRSVYYQKK